MQLRPVSVPKALFTGIQGPPDKPVNNGRDKHSIILLTSTIGLLAVMAALSWIEDSHE